MADLSIRIVDEDVKRRLRVRARVQHGRSMEAEIRAILEEAVKRPELLTPSFTALINRFADLGGVDLELPARSTPARSADLTS